MNKDVGTWNRKRNLGKTNVKKSEKYEKRKYEKLCKERVRIKTVQDMGVENIEKVKYMALFEENNTCGGKGKRQDEG